jgi:hypothetical protein
MEVLYPQCAGSAAFRRTYNYGGTSMNTVVMVFFLLGLVTLAVVVVWAVSKLQKC